MVTRRSVLTGLLGSLAWPWRAWAQPLPPSDLRINGDGLMATLRQVETGTVVLAAGSASQTATLATTLLDTAKAFLLFDYAVSSASPGAYVRGVLTNTTTLTFDRVTSTGAPEITIRYYVAEFTAGVTVQRGAQALDLTSTDITISAVVVANAFPILCGINGPATFGGDDFAKAKITTTTNLNLTCVAAGPDVAWQVVEYTTSTVQTGDIAWLTTDASKTATITSVDLTKAVLFATFTANNGTGANIGQKLINGVITNATTLTFTRDNTGTALDLTWYVVEFTDSTLCQRGTAAFGTGDTVVNATLSPAINTAKAMVTASGFNQIGGKTPYSADDNPGVAIADLSLTSSTNLQLTRAATGSVTADVGWGIIEFDPAAGAAAELPGHGLLLADVRNRLIQHV